MIKFVHDKQEGAYSTSAQAWVCPILAEFLRWKNLEQVVTAILWEKNLVSRIFPTIFLLVGSALMKHVKLIAKEKRLEPGLRFGFAVLFFALPVHASWIGKQIGLIQEE